ncbi:MAG: mechanosensitive ion channel family protein [Actinomycetota bacterium]|nr:mechanosensitive ion channel family protein [Actinomycetota bacterium]
MTLPAVLAASAPPDRVADVCGNEPSAVCIAVLRETGRDVLAKLADTVVPAALKILLVVVLAVLAHHLLRRLIDRLTRRMTAGGAAAAAQTDGAPVVDAAPADSSRTTMRTETIGAVLGSVATVTVWTVAAVMVLGAVSIELGPLLAGAGIVGVALGFGAQNLVKDFLSGLFIIVEDQYGIGDVVELRDAVGNVGVSGTLEAISLRTSRVRDVEGTVWHVPNGEIRTAGNRSQEWARSVLDIGVAYDTDLAHATAVLKRVGDGLWHDGEFGAFVLEEPEVWGLERFDADRLAIRMVLKVSPAKQWAVNRELRARIKAAFGAEGIEMPLPQRTVWMRTADGAAARDAGDVPRGELTPAKQSGNAGDTAAP